MNLKRSAYRAAMLTTALVAVLGTGVGASFADTSGRSGIGSGNQVKVPVNAPVDVCGNGVAVLGRALGVCPGGASTPLAGSRTDGLHTSGRRGLLSGNQVRVPITAPVNVCGNGVGVLGRGLGACRGGATVGGDDGDENTPLRTNGRHSVLSGNQVDVPVTAPVNACGNAVGNALAACQGGAEVLPGADDDMPYPDASSQADSRDSGSGSGNDLDLPVDDLVQSTLGLTKLPGVGDLTKNLGNGATGQPGLPSGLSSALPSGLGS